MRPSMGDENRGAAGPRPAEGKDGLGAALLVRFSRRWRVEETLPLLLFEHAPEDLTRGRLRDRLDELHLVEGLVGGEAAFRPRQERLGGQGGILPNDERLRYFARFGIGLTDHGDVGDTWVLEEERLDLGRRHAEALVLDHLFLPVGDGQVTSLVDVADVARVEPAVTERRRRGFRRIPVAEHDLGAADDDFTHLARPERTLPGLQVDDPLLGIVDGQAGGVDREQTLVMNGVEVGDRAGLAESIALDDLDA